MQSNVLSKMLISKKAAFPYVSLSIAAACILVSLPAYFRPNLYEVLALSPANSRWWQFITFQFNHAEPKGGMAHLFGCLAALILFGLPIERILGSARFFVLTCAGFLTCLIYSLVMVRDITWANGASGMVVGYLAFAPSILAWAWRRYNSQLFWFLRGITVAGIALFLLMGLATLLRVIPNNHANPQHAISILTAVPFLMLWRKSLVENLDKMQKDEPIQHGHPLGNRLAVGASFGLLLLNMIILSGAVAGWIVYIPCDGAPKVTSKVPANGNLDLLNNYRQRVTIRFDRAMKKQINSVSQSITYRGQPLDFVLHWNTPDTLIIQFGREVFAGDKIKIGLSGLEDMNGVTICDPIQVEYK